MVSAPGRAAPVASVNGTQVYARWRSACCRRRRAARTSGRRRSSRRCPLLTSPKLGRRRVLVDVAAVQLIDEVHVAGLVELDAFVRRPRNHVLVHEVRAHIARRRQRIDDARRVDRVLQLEQAAVGLRCDPPLPSPRTPRRDERAPRRPEGRHRKRRGRLATGLCQIVSVTPVSRSWRCTPDCPVSNTVNR